MATSEKVPQPSTCAQPHPGGRGAAAAAPSSSLVTDERWDRYDPASLLPLKEVVRENGEFGFLLRHYWIPATQLRFRQSSRQVDPNGNVDWQELQIDRQMVRCRSNECTWRETVRPASVADGNDSAIEATAAISEMLCSYDCYEQTYVSAKPIQFAPPTADQKEEARCQALYRMPILVPPGPVPIGFSWYSKVREDYMSYHLEKEEHIGSTSVLVIRREGCYTVWLPESAASLGNGQETTPVVTKRQGVTILAWNRGTVLEDRFRDQVIEAAEPLSARVGTVSRTVSRLERVCSSDLR